MCADMVAVRWKDKSGWDHKATAVLDDISRSGACLQTEEPLPVRATVQISCNKGRFEGSVAYCFFREIGYYIGVKFAKGTKWSKQKYRPKYLLDEKLVAAAPSGRRRKARSVAAR
jgi:hypothetical protein